MAKTILLIARWIIAFQNPYRIEARQVKGRVEAGKQTDYNGNQNKQDHLNGLKNKLMKLSLQQLFHIGHESQQQSNKREQQGFPKELSD